MSQYNFLNMTQPLFFHDQKEIGWELKTNTPPIEKGCTLILAPYPRMDSADRDLQLEIYKEYLSGRRCQLAGQHHAEAVMRQRKQAVVSDYGEWAYPTDWWLFRCLIFAGTVWEDTEGDLRLPALQKSHGFRELIFCRFDELSEGTALVSIPTTPEELYYRPGHHLSEWERRWWLALLHPVKEDLE